MVSKRLLVLVLVMQLLQVKRKSAMSMCDITASNVLIQIVTDAPSFSPE